MPDPIPSITREQMGALRILLRIQDQLLTVHGSKALPCAECHRHGLLTVHELHEALERAQQAIAQALRGDGRTDWQAPAWESIAEMRRCSDIVDEQCGYSGYDKALIELALVAREFLRRIPDSAPPALLGDGRTTEQP